MKMVGAWLSVYRYLQTETLMCDIHGIATSLCVSWVYALCQCMYVSQVAELLSYLNGPTLVVFLNLGQIRHCYSMLDTGIIG